MPAQTPTSDSGPPALRGKRRANLRIKTAPINPARADLSVTREKPCAGSTSVGSVAPRFSYLQLERRPPIRQSLSRSGSNNHGCFLRNRLPAQLPLSCRPHAFQLPSGESSSKRPFRGLFHGFEILCRKSAGCKPRSAIFRVPTPRMPSQIDDSEKQIHPTPLSTIGLSRGIGPGRCLGLQLRRLLLPALGNRSRQFGQSNPDLRALRTQFLAASGQRRASPAETESNLRHRKAHLPHADAFSAALISSQLAQHRSPTETPRPAASNIGPVAGRS